MGRVDGLLTEGTATVVEEIKSTAMDAYRLMSTDASDWPQSRPSRDLFVDDE